MKKILIMLLMLFVGQVFSNANDLSQNSSPDNYLRVLEQKIYKNYSPSKKADTKQTIVKIVINKNGDLIKSEIIQSSGISSFDKSIIKAINSASPFEPLPNDIKDDTVSIKLVFSDYLSSNFENLNYTEKEPIINRNNSLQEADEEKKKKESGYLFFKLGKFLMIDDYNMSQKHKEAETLYSEINNEAYKLSKKDDNISKLNYRYLILVKQNIINLCSKNKSINKIKVSNDEYKLLNKTAKEALIYNNIASESDGLIDTNRFQINEGLLKTRQYFEKNKNNIKNNREIYDSIKNETTNFIDFAIKLANENKIKASNGCDNLSEILNNTKTELNNLAKEIYDYSYNYEVKIYNNWLKQNNKKQIVDNLYNAVYQPYFQPKTGLYQYNGIKYYPLQVVQTVPGGVILSGISSIGPSIPNSIFLQTTKQYADGQMIQEPIIAEYKGFYDYTTVLGAHKRIYKFYRYGQSEINNNFKMPNHTFYFYKP